MSCIRIACFCMNQGAESTAVQRQGLVVVFHERRVPQYEHIKYVAYNINVRRESTQRRDSKGLQIHALSSIGGSTTH